MREYRWKCIVCESTSSRPYCTRLTLDVGDQYIGEDIVPRRIGEDWISKVIIYRGGVVNIIWIEDRLCTLQCWFMNIQKNVKWIHLTCGIS